MRKTIFSLAGMFVFITLVLGIVNASIYEDLVRLDSQGCNIIYEKSSAPAELVSKFGGGSACSLVLDYFPFQQSTRDLIEDFPFYYTGVYEDYYGQIEHYDDIEGDEYVFLFGEDSAALDKVIDLIANYETHTGILSEDSAIFFKDYYFELYPGGVGFVAFNPTMPYPLWDVEECVDNSLNVYEQSIGFYTLDENVNQFSSLCIDSNSIEYPYCFNETAYALESFSCDCVNGKCLPSASNVFYSIRWLGESYVTEDLFHLTINAWLDY